MADFINTIDALGDDVVMDSIIDRSITEFKDDKLTVLGARALSGCTHLQSVNLPNVKHYNTQALSGCTALTDVSLPELVDYVENSYAQGLFYGCTALQSINLPKLTNVSGQLFTGCSKLSSIELPVAEAVGTSAFENCKALTVAAFPKVTTIAGRAFFGCTALETVDLPKVETAAKDAFTGCTALTNVSLPLLKSSNNQLFQNCTSLESISLPEHTGALNYTFMGCSALKSVNLPKATEVSNTFLGGSAVTELRLPAVTKAGNNAFRECAKLKQVDLPVCTQLLAYSLYNLGDLKAVILRSSTICSMADQTVLAGPSGPNTLVKIYVPTALVDSYKAAANWSTYADQFRNLEEWTVDGTVTGELDIENRHMVRFYNSDGTLLGYQIVATGGSATYTGTPVCPEDSTATFDGFAPAPTNVTADMDCYAQFRFAMEVAEITDNWPTILASVADGTYKRKYRVGNYKPLDLGEQGVVNMQIVAFDADDLADGSGKAPVTWISKELLNTNQRMNPEYSYVSGGTVGQEGTGAIGGWEKCEMRTHLNNTILPLIPDNVRSAIKTVNKYSCIYDANETMVADALTSDSVWIPSYREIFGGTVETNGPIYDDIYKDATSRIKGRLPGVSVTNPNSWWTRSVYNKTKFRYINSTGKLGSENSNYWLGICLGFCT